MSSLQAAPDQLHRIKQARKELGWPIDHPTWLIAASKIITPQKNWDKTEKFAVSIGTWKRFLTGKPIRPEPYKAFCQVLGLSWQETIAASPNTTKYDWGEAPDTPIFINRSTEMSTLRQWITTDRARIISILGSGGIGKTALVTNIAIDSAKKFEYVIWRSLREAPTVEKIISDCLKLFSDHYTIDPQKTLGEKITDLIDHLRINRCLIILDNAESIRQSGSLSGNYLPQAIGYSELFKRLGESAHQSCLLITSREQLRELRRLQGTSLPVRSFQLTGLQKAATPIFTARDVFGSDQEISQLVDQYHGNPLALEFVAAIIKDNFNYSISKFLKSAIIFDDIQQLLTDQFNRLSPSETSIIYWLAIHREAVKPTALVTEHLTHPEIIAALDALLDRSFIQTTNQGYTLQNVVMEYTTDRFIRQISQELQSQQFDLFKTHAIIQATAKEYIRETQQRLILAPIAHELQQFYTIAKIEQNINSIINYFRQQQPSPNNLLTSFFTGYSIGNIINLLIALEIDLTGYDFSFLPIAQAYLQGANLPAVNFAHCQFQDTVFSQSLGSIFTVVFSPDQKILATGGMDGQIRLWQIADGQQISAWPAHDDWIRHLTFSPDGHMLASSSNDCTIKIWDWQRVICLHTLHGHTDWVWSSRFVGWRNFLVLVSVSSDRTAKIWYISLEKCLFTFHEPNELMWSVAFSSDGRTIAASSAKSVKLQNIWTKRCIRTFSDNASRIRALAFSTNGKTLVGSDDHQIKIWEVASGKCLKAFDIAANSAIWSLSYSPDGRQLISAGTDKIQIWNAHNWQAITTLSEPRYRIRSIAYSPDQTMMAVGSDDQLIRIWDTQNSQPVTTWYGAVNRIWAIVVSPPSTTGTVYLASGSDDCQIRIWNAATGHLLKTFTGHQGRIRCLAFSPSGKLLASASHDRTIKLWDMASGECLKTWCGHTDWVWSVLFSPDEQTLISTSDDRTVLRWQIATNESVAIPNLPTEWIWSIAAHPQLPILAITGTSQQIELWNIDTYKLSQTLIGHQQRVRSIVFNLNGNKLASSSDDRTIKLWDVSHNHCLQTLAGHTKEIRALSFIAASTTTTEMLVSASDDLTMRVWDTNNGHCLGVLNGHTQSIWSICYSPELQILYSCSQDETIKLWDLQTLKCLDTLSLPRPYQGMNISGVSGLSIATQNTLMALGAF